MRVSLLRASCAAAVLAAAVAAGGIASAGGAAPAARPGRPPEPLPRLSGPALAGPARLRLVASGNAGGVFVLDADRGTTQTVGGLGLGPAAGLYGPILAGLWPAPGGVLAEVERSACSSCGTRTTVSLIGPGGGARRIASIVLHGGSALVPAFDAATFWRLTWPNGAPCSLGPVYDAAPTVTVPCGRPAAATSAGVWIASNRRETIVDPRSGRVVATLAIPAEPGRASWLYPLRGTLALEYSGPSTSFTGIQRGDLSLVDLASGTRQRLAWPSWFRNVIRVVPEPGGPLVAVDYGSPAWPGPAQAEDVWILDTTRGSFTHLPGYPAAVAIKFSSVLWTGDGRLAIAAQGGGRAVLALWRPGMRTLPLRTIPSRHGYTTSAAFGG